MYAGPPPGIGWSMAAQCHARRKSIVRGRSRIKHLYVRTLVTIVATPQRITLIERHRSTHHSSQVASTLGSPERRTHARQISTRTVFANQLPPLVAAGGRRLSWSRPAERSSPPPTAQRTGSICARPTQRLTCMVRSTIGDSICTPMSGAAGACWATRSSTERYHGNCLQHSLHSERAFLSGVGESGFSPTGWQERGQAEQK